MSTLRKVAGALLFLLVFSPEAPFSSPGVPLQLSAAQQSGDRIPGATDLGRTPSQPPLALPGRPARALARLFTPRAAPAGAFRVSVIDLPLDQAREVVRQHFEPPGASRDSTAEDRWRATRQSPLAAFGQVAPYNKSKLAQLYVDRLVEVVRVPIEREGRVAASLTLISPYPDASLSRLEPGTLAILFDVAAARTRR